MLCPMVYEIPERAFDWAFDWADFPEMLPSMYLEA